METAPTSEQRFRRLSQALLFGTSFYALFQCPHSKVEESFQLQATHDLFYHGLTGSDYYDHLQYPGVVPRTFVGPTILACSCRVIVFLLSPIMIPTPLQVQFLARFLLMMAVLLAWFRFANATSSSRRGTYLLLITAVQFHMPFYASRMLPNTFALVVVLHAYSEWLVGNIPRSAILLVTATTVFRCDVILLLFSVGLNWLIRQQLSLFQAIRLGILTGACCLAITVPLDSWLWKQPWIWPEGQVFYYNTILNKSSNWGVSPWYWYITSAIPKAMLLTLLLVPLAFLRFPERLVGILLEMQDKIATTTKQRSSSHYSSLSIWDSSMVEYMLPIAGFVALYSCLGHKEMRFLFPAMPMMNLAAARGLERLDRFLFLSSPDKQKFMIRTVVARLGYGVGIVCLLTTLLASLVFVRVSKLNYPGGTALQALMHHVQQKHPPPPKEVITVHIDVAAAMSGVSLFGQREAAGWSFIKAGYEEENSITDYSDVLYLISETNQVSNFRVVTEIPCQPRLNWRQGKIETDDVMYVMERKDVG